MLFFNKFHVHKFTLVQNLKAVIGSSLGTRVRARRYRSIMSESASEVDIRRLEPIDLSAK